MHCSAALPGAEAVCDQLQSMCDQLQIGRTAQHPSAQARFIIAPHVRHARSGADSPQNALVLFDEFVRNTIKTPGCRHLAGPGRAFLRAGGHPAQLLEPDQEPRAPNR